MAYTASDLPITDDGRVYHLHLRPEQLRRNVWVAGDPGRAKFVGENYLAETEFTEDHRGLYSVGGITHSGHPVLITTSGDRKSVV